MQARARRPLLVVASIWLLHSVGLVSIVAEPAALLDGRPFLDQDWGLHHSHLVAAESFLRLNGELWGYNPSHMAGYPSNTHLDASIKAFELAALATPVLATTQAFQLEVFAATSAIPILGALACLGLSGRRRLAWPDALAAGLFAVIWWSGYGREMLFYGMVGWPVGAAFALVVLALFARVLDAARPLAPVHVAWLLACALLLPLHLQAAIMLPLPGLVLMLGHPRRRDPVVWGWALGGVAFALVANGFWLAPLFAHFGDENAGRVVAALPVFVSPDAWTFVRDYATGDDHWSFREPSLAHVFRIVLAGLGTAGLVRLARAGRGRLAATLATLVGSLFVMTYFGSLDERVQLLQPLRFKLPLDLALALCIAVAWEDVAALSRRARSAAAAALGVGLIAAAVGIAHTESTGRMRLHSELLPPIAALVDFLRETAPHEGRILFEESGDESGFVYGGVYLSSFLPGWTGHQLIGGPINLYADRHAHAELHSGRLFGRDPRSFSDAELWRDLALYNIGTLVAFDPVTIRRFRALGDRVVPLRRFARRIMVFRVEQPLDWFVEGEGRVDAEIGELRLHDVRPSPETGAIVLKYHWIEGLRAEPPLAIEPVRLGDDPIPFIRIADPPARFRLTVGGDP
jgi:hypothetical protein